jgi:hypothetical protein
VAEWKSVEELFNAALAQPLSDRAAFLRQASDDEPLRREVEDSPLATMAEELGPPSSRGELGRFQLIEAITLRSCT